MRLNTKARTAVTALTDVAMHSMLGPVALRDVSIRQELSLSYLEQLFGCLRRKGFVASVRGPGGGYTLGRAPDDISIYDIVAAVDERRVDDAVVEPLYEACADDNRKCSPRELWAAVDEHLVKLLKAIPLQKIVDQQTAIGVQSQHGQLR